MLYSGLLTVQFFLFVIEHAHYGLGVCFYNVGSTAIPGSLAHCRCHFLTGCVASFLLAVCLPTRYTELVGDGSLYHILWLITGMEWSNELAQT